MIIEYNRQNAVEYATKWALNRNPNFYNFDEIGGDCTNYISQCLLAGNGKMNFDKYYGWFYSSQHSRSPSWTSVKYLQKFLLTNNSLGPFAHIAPLSVLKEGDLIQLRQNDVSFNHTVIITQIINGEIYVCAHTNDALNKPLNSYFYYETMGIKIDGIYV